MFLPDFLRLGVLVCLIGPAAGFSDSFEAVKQELAKGFAEDPVGQCRATAEDAATCIGQAASACEHNPLVTDELTAVMCVDLELQSWDAALNQIYGDLIAKLKAEGKNIGIIEGQSAASRVTALREMQRGWIPYRNAKCNFEGVQMGTGTAGTYAATHCLLRETAVQALYLESTLLPK